MLSYMKRDHSGKRTLNYPLTDTFIHINMLTTIWAFPFLPLRISSSNSLQSCIGLSFIFHLLVEAPDILKILRPEYGTNKLHSCKSNQIFLQELINEMDPFHTEHHIPAPCTQNTWQLLCIWHHYIIIIIIVILLSLLYYNWIIWMLVNNDKTSYIHN